MPSVKFHRCILPMPQQNSKGHARSTVKSSGTLSPEIIRSGQYTGGCQKFGNSCNARTRLASVATALFGANRRERRERKREATSTGPIMTSAASQAMLPHSLAYSSRCQSFQTFDTHLYFNSSIFSTETPPAIVSPWDWHQRPVSFPWNPRRKLGLQTHRYLYLP